MDKIDLKRVDLKFHSKLKELSTDEEKWIRYEDYCNWLSTQSTEKVKNADYFYWIALLNACKFLKDCSLKAIDVSKKWNSGLVHSTYEFCKWARENKKNYPKEYDLKLGVLCNKIINETDFATKVYCLSVLQNDKYINLAAEAANALKTELDANEEFDQPFGKIGNYSKLQFLSKDEKALNELVTIPQAIEMGLNLHFLQWTVESGHQPMYLNDFELERMGFEKPTEDHTPIWEVDESTLTETEKENLKELDKVINEIMAPVTNVD